jgi:hypothetical protein
MLLFFGQIDGDLFNVEVSAGIDLLGDVQAHASRVWCNREHVKLQGLVSSERGWWMQ